MPERGGRLVNETRTVMQRVNVKGQQCMMQMGPDLARLLEKCDRLSTCRYTEVKREADAASGSAWQPCGDGAAVYTGEASPIVGVYGLGMEQPAGAQDLDAAAAFFAQRGAPAVIHLCPLADPSLAAALVGRMRAITQFKHVWVRSLEGVVAEDIGGPKVAVREAVTPEDRLAWARLVSWGFHHVGRLEDASTDISGITALRPEARLFVGTVDGALAGAGALTIQEGVGLLFSTSTVPPLRGLGVQTALIQARLAAARAAGCTLAMVQTIPGAASQRNVERAGFRIAYTRLAVQFD